MVARSIVSVLAKESVIPNSCTESVILNWSTESAIASLRAESAIWNGSAEIVVSKLIFHHCSSKYHTNHDYKRDWVEITTRLQDGG